MTRFIAKIGKEKIKTTVNKTKSMKIKRLHGMFFAVLSFYQGACTYAEQSGILFTNGPKVTICPDKNL